MLTRGQKRKLVDDSVHPALSKRSVILEKILQYAVGSNDCSGLGCEIMVANIRKKAKSAKMKEITRPYWLSWFIFAGFAILRIFATTILHPGFRWPLWWEERLLLTTGQKVRTSLHWLARYNYYLEVSPSRWFLSRYKQTDWSRFYKEWVPVGNGDY